MHNRFAQQYAYHFMSAQTVYQAFLEIVQPDTLGFTEIKRGTYARAVTPHIFHRMNLQALKGATYGIWWGVSLTYVPNYSREKLSWHRTLKSSRYDLFEMPAGYPPLLRSAEAEVDDFTVPIMFGETCFRNELTRIWSIVGPTIRQWFANTTSLQQVLQRADEQMKRKWDIDRYPDPAVVHLLTIAKLGDPQAALNRLSALTEETDGKYLNSEQLKKAIQIISDRT